ncbi:MAG: protein-L-isoaspartate(D-aspartate) O-methyltransferase [Spirochaetales bacterium]|nr:protein-L-isoaspartate(D-aspartate) O-methyltransferase [Spirochaetales bacterium]
MDRKLCLLLAVLAAGCRGGMEAQDHFLSARERMVQEQLRGRGIKNEPVLSAMFRIERHRFVPDAYRKEAYYDGPLPIGKEQTISQPYIVALMTELLDTAPGMRVLEIGTGSGYQTAVLAELQTAVFSIEIVPELCERSRKILLEELKYRNVMLRCGDGYAGWPEDAPFDRIMLTAAPASVPEPLLAQLKAGGKMVSPVGTAVQQLMVFRKDSKSRISVERNIPVRFVPMTGRAEK